MELVTWNVNSLRARLPRLVPWLAAKRPEVVCLQETKVPDDLFPREPLEELGYEIALHGQRSYNGVAILSRVGLADVEAGMGGGDEEDERRVIGATVAGGLRVLSVYVVNGQSVGSDRYRHKLRWMGRLRDFVAERHGPGDALAVCGDFNCTFDDRDVYDPEAWRGRILCSDAERAALAGLVDLGLRDAFRKFEEGGGHYTWWDFRTQAFRRDRGLRIDHALLSPPAWSACTAARIDREIRADDDPAGKPSDHAPLIVTLAGEGQVPRAGRE